MDAIVIEGLSKTYADKKLALNGLNLTVKQGEIFSLLGSNGAGKTTLINILTTFLTPSSGSVRLLGKDLEKNLSFVRSNIACVAQHVSVDDNLTLTENMKFQAGLYGLSKDMKNKRMDQLMKIFELSDYRTLKTEALSGGIKRRLDIAMSLIASPKIVFLDEPTVGMDIQSRRRMWGMLKQIKKEFGVTIFLTTHYLEEADLLSDTICFMKDGKNILQDSPSNLKDYTTKNLIRITVAHHQDTEEVKTALLLKEYVQSVVIDGRLITAHVNQAQQNYTKIINELLSSQVKFEEMNVVEPTLNDLFLEIMEEKES